MKLHPNAGTLVGGIAPSIARPLNPRRRSIFRPPFVFTFSVEQDHAPALRSAIDEISNEIGGRLTSSFIHAKEGALTDAAIALGALRAAVFAQVKEGDPNYA